MHGGGPARQGGQGGVYLEHASLIDRCNNDVGVVVVVLLSFPCV